MDEWVKGYEAGKSLREIAGDSIDSVTVWNHLRRRGVAMRDKVEAQIEAVTKYDRPPFQGDLRQIAYLEGFAKGDLYVTTHGRGIRAKTSTTHPAMSKLFHDLFGDYGHVREYPREAELTGHEWSLECDLDSSFGFLKDEGKIDEVIGDADTFLYFLSGFFDAEGSLYFHKKSFHGGFELSISNMDGSLLEKIAARLVEDHFSPKVRRSQQLPDRGVKNGSDHIWRLSLWRWEQVQRLMQSLKSRHEEKIEKIQIARKLGYRPSEENRGKVISEWNSLKARIEEDRRAYLKKAETTLAQPKAA